MLGAQDVVEVPVPARLALASFPLEVPDRPLVELLLLVVGQQVVSDLAEQRRPELQVPARGVPRQVGAIL
jgi:hypothetical protein